MPHFRSSSFRPRIAVLAASSLPLCTPSWLARAMSGMSPSERRYIARFRSPTQKQARCIARRLAVQAAQMLGYPGKLLALERDAHGRPLLPGTDLDVSFSHTPGLTVCAMSLGCRVGVDVELQRELQFEDIAPALSGPEKRRVQSGNLPSSLLSCWTAKEAVLKGDGRGFGPGLEAYDLFATEPILGGTRWHVSRHVFKHEAAVYLYALATDVSDAVVEKDWGTASTPDHDR
jgi:4'-phosphopantetheinyl transferase